MPTDTVRQKHREGLEQLNAYWARLDGLEAAINEFSETALSFVEEPIERVQDKIRAFEPSVSVIGQIKAGKSTLLNALIGETNLLPSDVNPWTSVITSLHLNSRYRPMDTRALFRFFDQHEWDRLVATGGRLGEMSARAGFETEADEVRAQVVEMRETTEARLGDEFGKLIGTSRAYPELDHDIIDRYICYGDPSELEDGADEGVYADITKSADLYIDVEGLPKGLCLRDTPGVNDTFMMREQITLNAISDSRVCVVVLSAHQALSTMDVAILRIISAVEAREVLIFVNRIDELEDPKGESEKISASIRKTLARLGLNDDIDILFGSAHWANFALTEGGSLSGRSRAALASMNPDLDFDDTGAVHDAAFAASGVLQLHMAIAERVVQGPGAAFLKDVEAEIENIIEMSETVDKAAEMRRDGKIAAKMTSSDLMLRIADVLEKTMTRFDSAADDLRTQLRERLERTQETFVVSAIDALHSHVGLFGETGSWEHDPMALRMGMKTAFASATSKLRREGETAFEVVLDGVEDMLQGELGVFRKGDSIEFPEQPQHKAPTVLARTISLDLDGGFWQKFWHVGGKRFLKLGGTKKIEKKYRQLIIDETTPLIDDLISDFFEPAIGATREIITTFALDQGKFCEALLERLNEADDAASGRAPAEELRRLSA